MKHVDTKIHNISDLISKLEAHRNFGTNKVWFRGHADSSWTMQPSIARGRTNPIVDEFQYYKSFKQEAARVITTLPNDEWGWMFLMQHYGIPTRLLDFTENPLIALYFAVAEHPDKEGSLIVLEPITWNKEQGRPGLSDSDLPACGIDEEMEGYLMSNAVKSVGGSGSNPPLAAIGARNSQRIFAQEGTFVVTHLDLDMDINSTICKSAWRYTISAADKETIKGHLATLSISEYTVFPELKTLAKKIVS